MTDSQQKLPDRAALADTLAEEVLDTAPWDALAPHYGRGVVLFVEGLSLTEVGAALVLDDVETVEGWLEDGLIRRPDDNDADEWNASNPTFDMLVVQPWVLVSKPQTPSTLKM